MSTTEKELPAQLLDIARRIEGMKRECGMDPESPIAIHNAGLMSISYAVRELADRARQVVGEPVAYLATDQNKEKYLCFHKRFTDDTFEPLYLAATVAQPATEASPAAVNISPAERAANAKTLERWSRASNAKQAEAPSDYRKCEFCHCNTNAKMRRCCINGATSDALATQPTASNAGERDLPPYIYGREAAPNEKVWTESAVRAALASKPPQGEQKPVGWFKYDKVSECWHPQHEEYAPTHAQAQGWQQLYLGPQPEQVAQDSIDAERWRAFIGLEYKVRAEWACNLSLVPMLTEWVDQRAARARGEGGAKG